MLLGVLRMPLPECECLSNPFSVVAQIVGRAGEAANVIEEQDKEIAGLIASRNSVVVSSGREIMERDEKIKLLLDELGVARTRLSDLGYSVFAIDLTLKRFER
jgi:hypothetical protein